jgi:hypothetical protein
VDFQSHGIGRNVRVFLVVFLGAVGVLEVSFWGRGVWVWYQGRKGKEGKGDLSGSGQD